MGGAHFTVLLGVQSSIMETTADDFWRFFIKCLANGTLTSSPRLLVKSYKRTKLYECVCVSITIVKNLCNECTWKYSTPAD